MSRAIVYKKPQRLLQHPLTTKQQVYANYLVPAIATSLIYILHFTADLCLALQHGKHNYFYASLTLFWIYVPVIGCIFFTVSDVAIWPEEVGFGRENIKWLAIKIVQHLFFPVWAMYRFAEQLFWSIEAARCPNEDEIEELLKHAQRNRVFELYHFLQAYLQAAPQILFQLSIIYRHTSKFNKETVDMQVFSIVMSLIKMALTTMSYQRFKSQKPAGRQYPWIKERSLQSEETFNYLDSTNDLQETVQEDEEANKLYTIEEKQSETEAENSEPEADRQHENSVLRKSSGLSITSSQFNLKLANITGPVLDGDESDSVEEVHEEPVLPVPKRVILRRGRTEDDAAGKLVSFFWWFCFILPRMLALSSFAYFFPKELWWLCCSHYIITLSFLLYDAHTADIPYYRAIFILFTAYVYMFCLIEFKIKFKKVKFIYIGYFTLVYFENFVMTAIWYYTSITEYYNDWWYNYTFYVITGSSIISLMSMVLYLTVLKPKKIVVNKEFRDSLLR